MLLLLTTSRMFRPYRRRSVESVIEELRYYKRLGFQYMNFEDDNFTADPDYAKEICRRMIGEGLVFRETFFFGRTDMARDEELLSLLEQAHLNRVLVGIESLNQEALDAIHKGQRLSDIEACGRALSQHKIRLIASIVLGIDADSTEDIRRAVDFTKRIGWPISSSPLFSLRSPEQRSMSSTNGKGGCWIWTGSSMT